MQRHLPTQEFSKILLCPLFGPGCYRMRVYSAGHSARFGLYLGKVWAKGDWQINQEYEQLNIAFSDQFDIFRMHKESS